MPREAAQKLTPQTMGSASSAGSAKASDHGAQISPLHVRNRGILSGSVKLDFRHICNAKLLPCREDLFDRLPKGGVVAELGVASGRNALSILQRTTPSMLHLMDLWPDSHCDSYRLVQQEFADHISNGRVVLHKGDDLMSLHDLPDAYFDWVYLDSSHEYDHTRAELYALAQKLKPRGILCGHDYVNYDVWLSHKGASAWYRLKQCIDEFCIENQWEFVYLTMESCINPSFAIRRSLSATTKP